MSLTIQKQLRTTRERRRNRVRHSLPIGRYPRLAVFRSNKNISAQVIDDQSGVTLIAAHEREVTLTKATPIIIAHALGTLIAKKAKAKKITKVVFDRRGYKFHGRVKAVADGAREGGLTI